jgi:hypothetical protein
MVGHIDGLIWCDTLDNLISLVNGEVPDTSKDEAQWALHHLELKTSAQIGFQNIVRKGMAVEHPEYMAQSQCYLHHLQDRDVRETWFVVENKNTNNVIGQCIPYLPQEYAKIENKLKMIWEVVKAGGLPDREHEKTEWFCSYCDYKEECWKE